MSSDSPHIAAVVVLYHPDASVLVNLGSIINQVAVLFVVDNSETSEQSVCMPLAAYANVSIIHTNGNIGIAAALNMAAQKALQDGCELLLTLDQDSCPLPGMIDALLACHAPGVGLVAPRLQADSRQEHHGGGCRPVLNAMTSGSLLNLAAYKEAGPFRDDFFIDFVDIEYCLRLHRSGFKILQADNAHLEHHVGTRIGLGGRLSVTTHSPIRKYYKTRNRLKVWAEYESGFPGYVLRDRIRFLLEFIRLLLFEPEKMEKLRMIRRGWRDFLSGKFGKYGGLE